MGATLEGGEGGKRQESSAFVTARDQYVIHRRSRSVDFIQILNLTLYLLVNTGIVVIKITEFTLSELI